MALSPKPMTSAVKGLIKICSWDKVTRNNLGWALHTLSVILRIRPPPIGDVGLIFQKLNVKWILIICP